MGWELHRLARATGRTAWATLHDPHLAFEVSVMRAHDHFRQVKRDLRMQRVRGATNDPHLLELARILIEEI
jgi:hypothetical protein